MTPAEPAGPGIALVGYRGAGKTTVGRLLAERLGWPFLDADRELEARLGRPIRSIFESDGEPAFRDHEEATLGLLCRPRLPLVLATGGGAVLRESNRLTLRAFGFVAWLRPDPLELVERLRRNPGDRPSLTAAGLLEEIDSVLAIRVPFYRDVSHAAIDTAGLSPHAVASAVMEAHRRFARQ